MCITMHHTMSPQVKPSSLASVRVLTSVNYTQPVASEQEARQRMTKLGLERSAVAVSPPHTPHAPILPPLQLG